MLLRSVFLLGVVLQSCCRGFSPSSLAASRQQRTFVGTTLRADSAAGSASASSAADEDEDEEAKLGDDGLPEIQGDFDWDAKFAGDDDWITENVPGKIVMNEIELAQQITALDKLEEKWRKERLIAEYEADKKVGWVYTAEVTNGRFAMFFLVTGLLTEYWTGFSMPEQVEEMLRVGGVLGFDG